MKKSIKKLMLGSFAIRQIFYTLWASFALFSCSTVSKSEQHKKHDVLLVIVSPYACNYLFHIKDDTLQIRGAEFKYYASEMQKISGGTFIGKVDTIIDKSVVKEWANFCDTIHKNINFEHELRQNDAYQYELYVNGELVRRSFCCDESLFPLLRLLKPYFNEKKFLCSGFFDIIKEGGLW